MLADWVVPKLARVEHGIEDYCDEELLGEVPAAPSTRRG